MLTEESMKIMLDGFFRRHEIISEYTTPINEDGKQVVLIFGIGTKGRFEMGVGEDCILWRRTLKGEWRLTDEYRSVGNEKGKEEQ